MSNCILLPETLSAKWITKGSVWQAKKQDGVQPFQTADTVGKVQMGKALIAKGWAMDLNEAQKKPERFWKSSMGENQDRF